MAAITPGAKKLRGRAREPWVQASRLGLGMFGIFLNDLAVINGVSGRP